MPIEPDSAPMPLDAERRQDFREWRDQVNARLDKGAAKIDLLELGLQANTAMTQANTVIATQVQSDTNELVAFFKSVKGAFDVFNAIGKLAKPLGYIMVALSSMYGLYHAWKSGTPPPKP